MLWVQFQVNTYTTSWQVEPAVASDAAGNFVVVWISQDGSGGGVFGQRYASTGSALGTEFQVNTYTTGDQGYPVAVSADAAGNFVVVWNSEPSYPAPPSDGQDGPLSTRSSGTSLYKSQPAP